MNAARHLGLQSQSFQQNGSIIPVQKSGKKHATLTEARTLEADDGRDDGDLESGEGVPVCEAI